MLCESTFLTNHLERKKTTTQNLIWVLDTATFLQTMIKGYHFPTNANNLHKLTFL